MNKEVKGGKVTYQSTEVVNTSSSSKSAMKNITSSRKKIFSGSKFVRSFSSGRQFTFVTFIFVLFFVLTVTAFIYKGRVFTFTGLLNFFSNYDGGYATAFTSLLGDVLVINSDWGLFNFLRDFFNTLLGFVSFIVRAIGGLIDVFSFLWNAFLVLLN